ncbi:Tim10/DDP family zinc finger [Pseudocohnilembus persalinus]|uniref:Tim10/DDP family zinc finger n=1 Tax=Pseudocohnilembus persalinus TaxID=266149 RepID=A0A0V0R2A7_PSEPJ|nr:Tim10/DDP family zinc finger [Pseudocohnilembus persalinus]|eukprot:KRX08635.1 Tim10/DDP family zinc finger [Pseudocohnilembus persalinus]
MDNEERKDQVDQIEKDINSQCFKNCFNLMNGQVKQGCFGICYNKYLETIKIVNNEIMQYGYSVHSILAYKLYPEENPYHEAYFTDKFIQQKSPISYAYDHVTNKIG